jgi:hypothetical protein
MPRLFWSLVLGLSGFVVAEGHTAPAPFSQPRGPKDALFLRVQKVVSACGYRLHELRPGQKSGEYALVISDREAGEAAAVSITTRPAGVAQLMNPELLELIVLVAAIEATEKDFPLHGRRDYPCRTLRE